MGIEEEEGRREEGKQTRLLKPHVLMLVACRILKHPRITRDDICSEMAEDIAKICSVCGCKE